MATSFAVHNADLEFILNQRATGPERLNGDVFITPDAVFELGKKPDGTDANTNGFFDAACVLGAALCVYS